MNTLNHLPKMEFFKNTVVTLLFFFVLWGCKTGEKEIQKPNIIFIMADDLGYGHLGCYGQQLIQTPNIDRLATEGMRFTQAYAGCSLCAPARSTLLTGTHTGHTPVRGNGGGVSLQKDDLTVAQILKVAGYATGIFGKWGLGEAGTVGVPNKKGFDEFFGYLHQLHAQFYYPKFLWHNDEKVVIPENENNCSVYSPDLIMEKAFDFVRKHQSEPFFLYLPFTLPHHEFVAPEEDMKMYSGKFEEHPLEHWRDGYALPQEPRATMAAMISHMDKKVGELTALLKELNLDENTLIIFTSDNGAAEGSLPDPEFFKANGPLRGLKGSMYEGGIRVPMIARWTDHIQPGSISGHALYFPDVLLTFAELANVSNEVPKNIDGISFLPALYGKTNRKHNFMYWEDADYERTPPYGEITSTLKQAVLQGEWKAVKNSPDLPVELYNLTSDIGEQNNIAAEHPELVRQLEELMKSQHLTAPPQVDMTAAEAKKLYVPKKNCNEN